MSNVNAILAMDPEKYREIDGVVFDLDSYARHCAPADTASEPSAAPAPEAPPSAAPAPVFAEDPHHAGWYPAEDDRPPVPIMAGAIPPCESAQAEDGVVTVTKTIWRGVGSGSGSGSYVTSYTTSWRSSGSGSFVFGSGIYTVGGYGLELI